jgi:multidrug efflux pump subunit AcrA (membrane-fusion protein)
MIQIIHRRLIAAIFIFCLLFTGCRAGHLGEMFHLSKDAESELSPAADSEGTSTSLPQIKLSPEQKESPLLQRVSINWKSLPIELEVLGSIASDTDQVLQLKPESPGRVREILVAVGDTVEKGQTLLTYQSGSGSSGLKELKAPKRGVALGIYSEVGDYIDPVIPLVTLTDTSKLRCVFDLFEKDIGKVHKGETVQVRVSAFPQEIFLGNVTYISPRVNENTRTIKIRVDVSNPEGKLKFGMFANGLIQVGELKALVVPETALQTYQGKPSVFVQIQPDTLEVRPIQIGQKLDGMVEVKSGLKPGETIIAQGSFILKTELPVN